MKKFIFWVFIAASCLFAGLCIGVIIAILSNKIVL